MTGFQGDPPKKSVFQRHQFANKGIMQILDQKFFKKYPPQDLSAGLCGHAGCLGLAVEPKIWEKIDFENERG